MTLAGNGQEHLDVETVARELRLDQKSLQLLGKKLDAFDLLVLLVVASHTHFLTKARQGNCSSSGITSHVLALLLGCHGCHTYVETSF